MSEDKYGEFWNYISQGQKNLIMEGEHLMNDVIREGNYEFNDYSFLVFPYAKAFEGFLKQLFLDLKFLTHLQYVSNHLRIGKLMSPNLISRLRERSLYKRVTEASTKDLAERIWQAWKLGRNEIFHYYPHNLKAITFDQAEEVIGELIATMEEAYQKLNSNSKAQMSNQAPSTKFK